MDGNELFNYDAEVGSLGIWNVVCLGDGYLVQLGNTTDGETARLVKLSRDGGTLDTFIYEGEDCDYTITDMIEFGAGCTCRPMPFPSRQTGADGMKSQISWPTCLTTTFGRFPARS